MKKILIKKIRDKELNELLFQSGLHIQKIFRDFADNMDRKFDELMTALELVGKRIKITEQKIALLKSKHENLAQYCNQKIEYPEYDRKL